MDSKAEKFSAFSPYNYTLNNPMIFVDPDGNDVKPSKAFLSSEYGKVFTNLRSNNRSFQNAIRKYENNNNFNLTLSINTRKVINAGAGALTEFPENTKLVTRTKLDVNSFFMATTTIASNKDYKYTEIGVVLVLGHEAVHQKIALSSANEDDNHNTFNRNRQDLVSILKEYNSDNNLGLTEQNIKDISFAGQQDSREFKKYINDLVKQNNSTFKEEKDKYDTNLSRLIHQKK